VAIIDITECGGGQDKTAEENTKAYKKARSQIGNCGTIYWPHQRDVGDGTYYVNGPLDFHSIRNMGDGNHAKHHTRLRSAQEADSVVRLTSRGHMESMVIDGGDLCRASIYAVKAHGSSFRNVAADGGIEAAWHIRNVTNGVVELCGGRGSRRAWLIEGCNRNTFQSINARAVDGVVGDAVVEIRGYRYPSEPRLASGTANIQGLEITGAASGSQPLIWMRGVGGGALDHIHTEGGTNGILLLTDCHHVGVRNVRGNGRGPSGAYRVEDSSNILLRRCTAVQHRDEKGSPDCYARITWKGYAPLVEHCTYQSHRPIGNLPVEPQDL